MAPLPDLTSQPFYSKNPLASILGPAAYFQFHNNALLLTWPSCFLAFVYISLPTFLQITRQLFSANWTAQDLTSTNWD